MPNMNAEQAAAQEALQVAVEQHARAFRTPDPGVVEVAGDWLLISTAVILDTDHDDRRYAYNLAFSGGEQPEHIAYGLLHMAEALLRDGELS